MCNQNLATVMRINQMLLSQCRLAAMALQHLVSCATHPHPSVHAIIPHNGSYRLNDVIDNSSPNVILPHEGTYRLTDVTVHHSLDVNLLT